MRRKSFLLNFFFYTFFVLLSTVTSIANNSADDVLGDWVFEGRVKLNIYKKGDMYFGKIIWLKEPNDENGKPKVDSKNPEVSLRSRPLLGLEILRDFKFDGDDEWNGGRIYKTDEGSDYKCKMWFKDARTLMIKGYIGISLIGKTKEFVRPAEWK